MEFFISMVKFGGGITLVVILTSIFLLLFKRSRKTGIISLSVVFGMFLVLCLIFLTPRSYSKNYLESNEKAEFDLNDLATRNDFYLGSCCNTRDMESSEFRRSFNSITPENALKMSALFRDWTPGVYDFSQADSIVNFAIDHNCRIRGHTLIWGKLSDLFKQPDLEQYLEVYSEDERPAILKKLVDSHIRTVLNHYRGKISSWDVVNEPLNILGQGEMEENVYLKYLGETYVADAIRLAHEVDPEIKLFVNELLFNYSDERADGFYHFIRKMKESGVPIDGVGLQAHMIYSLPSVSNLKLYMKKFTDLGLEVELTEVDARLRLFSKADDPYIAQATYYGEILQACLENDGCKGLTFWGYTDKFCWMDGQMIFPKPNEPYFFDQEFNPKPVVRVYHEILSGNLLQ